MKSQANNRKNSLFSANKISGWLFRYEAGRSKTQTHLDNQMGNSPVFEHLQTLQNGVN